MALQKTNKKNCGYTNGNQNSQKLLLLPWLIFIRDVKGYILMG